MQFRAYLAGPIAGCTYGECTDWRAKAIELLPPEIVAYSPMRGKEYLEHRGRLGKMAYGENPLSTEDGIIARDFNDVQKADILIVNLKGATAVSIGTVAEMAWAWQMKVPVITIIEHAGNIHDHIFVRRFTSFRVSDLEHAISLAEIVLLPGRVADLKAQIAADRQAVHAAFDGVLDRAEGQS